MAGALKPRWGQPLTGIISNVVFFLVAMLTWYIFSDPRGPVGWFPYPFVMFLAIMILVGLWQHMFLGDWPFQDMKQPARGIVETIVNVVVTWFVIDVVFYRILGIGVNFLSYYGLEAVGQKGFLAQAAIVGFVLLGFYLYPLGTIFFGKWPIRPSDLKQPAAGLAEIGFQSLYEVFFYVILVVPFFAFVLKGSPALNPSWWTNIGGTPHLHWVFGWWEWMVIILFMFPNVWRMKPFGLIKLPQPAKGFIYMGLSMICAYMIFLICIRIIPAWMPPGLFTEIMAEKGAAEWNRFLCLHSAELAGMTLIPFLAWHHYFDDLCGVKDVDSWAGFWIRTFGVLFFAAILYWIYYYGNFGHWALGNHHMSPENLGHRFWHGESLVWNFWWIVPLLWNEWFFHKWPFYVHEH
jgi:amino acid transporter, AAT family